MLFKFKTLKLDFKLTTFLLIIFSLVFLHVGAFHFFKSNNLITEDIYFSWEEGLRIAKGINPYERIIGSDLRVNDKYPTYLPFFYVFAALLNKIGLETFDSFLNVWRIINFLSHTTIIFLIFRLFNSKKLFIQSVFASTVIGFSNISLHIIKIQHLEFFSVAFLLLSISFLRKRPSLSGILMGISILTKHFSLLFLPFIMFNLYSSKFNKGKKLFLQFSKHLIITMSIFIFPFLIWNPMGFIHSVGFSITRATTIPLLDDAYKILYLIIYLGLIILSRKVTKIPFQLSFLAIFLFNEFNPTVFRQYYFWVLIMGILAFYEINLLYKKNKIIGIKNS